MIPVLSHQSSQRKEYRDCNLDIDRRPLTRPVAAVTCCGSSFCFAGQQIEPRERRGRRDAEPEPLDARPAMPPCLCARRMASANAPQPLEPGLEGRMVDIEHDREDLPRDVVGDAEHPIIVLGPESCRCAL